MAGTAHRQTEVLSAPPPAQVSGLLLATQEFLVSMFAVAEAEIRKLRHDSLELLSRVIQPAVWLIVFGKVFAHLRDVPTGGIPYIDFITPGILAQSVLFVSVFFGVSVIWEKDLGILQKLLASPASRLALVSGKAVSAAVRAVPQAFLLYGLALWLGVRLWIHPLAILGAITFMALAAPLFCVLSMVIACLAKTRQRFMGVSQMLLMPLFFGSNAIYPVQMMPRWLRYASTLNPLTYTVDALRTVMLQETRSTYGLGVDAAVLLTILLVLLAVAQWLYPRVIN